MSAAARPGLQRRVQRSVLWTQGRLDSDHADRVLPWLLAAVVFAANAALHAARERSLDPGTGDAPWIQAVWRREHGWAGTPIAGADPAHATWSFVSEAVLWLARFAPPVTVFVGIQALALGVGVVPLWRLARREAHLRVGATSTIIAAYALAPTLHRANLGSFHPELLALPALLAAYHQALQRHWVRFGLLVAFTVACRADLGLTVAALGLVLASDGRRRAGLITAAGGLAWSLAAFLVIRPNLPAEALTPAGEFVARSRLPLAVFPDLLRHPMGSLQALVAEPSVLFIVVVLSPLLFLPLMSPRRLLMAVPALLLAMVADRAVQDVAGVGVLDLAPAAAHIAPAMAFVFIALVFALERIGRPSVTRVNVDRRVLLSLLAGATLLFVTESPSSPYRHPWTWGSRDAVDVARLDAVDQVGPQESVAGSPSVSALLAERGTIVELPPDPASITTARVAALAIQVDRVVLDVSRDIGLDRGGQREGWTAEDRVEVVARFEAAGFTETFSSNGIHGFEAPSS